MRNTVLLLLFLFISIAGICQGKRPLIPADVYRLKNISDPQPSPDGEWVAYVVSSTDTVKDKHVSAIWMTSWDGTQHIQLTSANDASHPRWSPDGKYISFLSGLNRGDANDDDKDDDAQIFLLDRRGGEAKKITNIKGDIEDYDWSPDGTKIVMSIKDRDYSDTGKTKIRKPYVIDRYHFKQDYEGYLDTRAIHLYLFDISSKKNDTLTRGKYDETTPVFSPDGTQIAFVSNRTEDPDRNENTDIYVIDAKPGAAMKQLTTWRGEDVSPVWSPDGKYIAYLQSSSDENFTMYGHHYLAVIPAAGGEPKLLSKSTDRPFENARWSADSKNVGGLFSDDRQGNIVTFDILTGQMTKVTEGDKSYNTLEYNMPQKAWVGLRSMPQQPEEVFVIENKAERKLTNVQDSFIANLQFADVKGFKATAKDGNVVSGLLYLPPGAKAGQKLPLIMFIHGGPVAQDEFEFDMTRQMYACAGYAVAAVNYRGSNGRGIDYIRAIYGDWGDKEELDILACTDYLIKEGIADENRLGIAGWSYGGISTDYTIATDQRFKAAVSGAGSALQLSMYGVDEYVTQYDTELGPPWKNPALWIKLSYPFFHADRIKTPTLFMASQKDFNVPSVGAEQMYQALRNLGVPTELIIYPNQNHGLVVPSYIKDRYERHIAWFNKYLKN
ncbi:MAG TPA: S9 family peptidase [Chitinophagaceae bacterium]|nr:S9 family peptidase [Chitinophagaceae bacterium]